MDVETVPAQVEPPEISEPMATKKIKPKYRGIPHVVGAALALPATLILLGVANPGIPFICAAIYGSSIVLMMLVSATYHTPMWPDEIREKWRALDHAMIFIQVGASYTPVCLLGLPEKLGIPLLWVAWILSFAGFFKTILSPQMGRRMRTALYWMCGWIVLPVMPQVYAGMDPIAFSWLFGGGGVFCVGSYVYVTRRPNPDPAIFGYHEVFHCFVVAGFACHFSMVWYLATL